MSVLKKTAADRIEAYIRLRDFKKKKEDAFKAQMKPCNDAMDTLENMLLADLDASGVESFRCTGGTAYKTTQMSVSVDNRDAFLECVKSQELWEALDVKANKTFVKEYMEQQGQPIPGLKITQVLTVGVRRS